MVHELLERLQLEQSSYPPAQKAVACYIVENYHDIPFRTISNIASQTGTSETTISKFCNSLGFSGFSGLKHIIAEYVNSEVVMNKKLERTVNVIEKHNIFSFNAEQDIHNIQVTLGDSLNQKNTDLFIEMLEKAQNIYILGARTSAFFAEYFSNQLMLQKLKAFSLAFDIGNMVEKLLMIGPQDLVIAFSFFRYTQSVVNAANTLHKKGVPIVLFTDYRLSPAYEFSDLVFKCKISNESLVSCSYTSCLSLLNVILMSRALRLQESLATHFDVLERHLTEYGVFFR